MSSTSDRIARLSPEKLAMLKRALGKASDNAEPIAVVGMGCRFPKVHSIQQYWDVIREGRIVTGEIPADRWDADAFFEQEGGSGKMITRWGGFVDDIDRFDASFFGVSPREAERMDPQQRLLLEVVWQAMEYGALVPADYCGSRTGVFVGVGGVDYSRIPVQLDDYYGQITAYSGTGNALSIVANRLSYIFDFRGPSLSVDTACSSSLVAAHMAIRSLRSGESDAAVVAGVNTILTPETTIAFSQAQMLSRTGQCRPFDADAAGYVRGEGCGAVVLKRLSDAEANGDMVLAVIRGSAVNQDGRTSGIAAPNGPSQEACIHEALKDAALTPDDVTYIEAHGTGTPLGDPIEVEALAHVFRRKSDDVRDCYFGSVKANIGHTETVAGMASLIKLVLLLQHGQIPKQPHFEKLNPHIRLEGSRLRIAEQAVDWQPASDTRIAGVSSFGFGGTNAHLVLEQASEPAPIEATEASSKQLYLVSAKTENDLSRLAGNHAAFLRESRDTLAQSCYNSAVGRSHFGHRLVVSGTDRAQIADALQSIADQEGSGAKNPRNVKRGEARGGKRSRIAFLFTGQGSQHIGMGRELYEKYPRFRECLDACDEILADQLPHRLLDVLWGESADKESLHQTQYTQPALFALQYSLAQTWRALGVEPAVVMGHSVGEFAAACTAGVFTLEDGLRLIAHRGRLMQNLPSHGAMAVIFATLPQVEEALEPFGDDVVVGVHNGPQNVVVSGTNEAVAKVVAAFDAEGVRTQALNVSHAFHSPLMDPILDEFEQHAAAVAFERPRLAMIANRTGLPIGDAICRPEYWRDHLRHTVLFADSVNALADQDVDVALELGPGTTLLGMARRAWSGDSIEWVPSLKPDTSDWDTFTNSLADLHVLGVNVKWSELYKAWPQQRAVLPVYEFEGQSYWYDMSGRDGSRGAVRASATGASHPLLGRQLVMAGDKLTFESSISTESPAYLDDHRVEQSIVVPAAAYIEQALAAAEQIYGAGANRVVDLSIQQAMMLTDRQRRTVQLIAGPESKNECPFEIYSRGAAGSDDWILHATGTLKSASTGGNGKVGPVPGELIEQQHDHTDGRTFYERLSGCGLRYGPQFQVVHEIWVGDDEAVSRLLPPDGVRQKQSDYHVHPSILDACLQTVAGVISSGDDEANDLFLPVGVKQVVVHEPVADKKLFVHARLAGGESEMGSVETNILLLDESGRRVAELIGARVQRVAGSKSQRVQDGTDWLYQIEWQPEALSEIPPRGKNLQAATQWMVLGHRSAILDQVTEHLRGLGDPVSVFEELPAGESIDRSFYEDALRSVAENDQRPNLQVIDLAASTIPDQGTTIPDQVTSETNGSPDAVTAHLNRHAIGLLQAVGSSKAWNSVSVSFLTGHAAVVTADDSITPATASMWGLVRSAAMEMPSTKIRLFDGAIDSVNLDAVLAELRSDGSETQIAYRDRGRFVARLNRSPNALSVDSNQGRMRIPTDRFSLRLTTPGSFDALRYAPVAKQALAAGEIEVEVHSTGLNFSDVLKALGLYPGIKDEIVPLGIECAGVVTAIGPDVDRFTVGQRVMGVAPYGFASHVVTPEYTMVATPDSVSDNEAATIPITFLTAFHGLCRLARMQPGEKVLIHAGAGGVGQAAIQIAHAIGAEVFATAGSTEKRDFLRTLGVQHVMDSRTTEFADEVMQITDGQGVDIVLNSLPGEAITKSLSILSAYGRFLEIGKTDIYQNRPIGLWPFQDNLSYFAIDLDRMLRQRPAEIRSLYDEMMPYFESGDYRPLRLTSFAADQVADAFRYMAQRKNIGKVVVSMIDRSCDEDTDESTIGIREQSTYLITGGTGALGLQLAKWLSDRGATHLALLSRRKPDLEMEERLTALRQSGVSVAVLQGDVSDRDKLASALGQLPKEFPSVRGVIHAAGVLDDGLLSDLSDEQLNRVLAPKVTGTWNLHELLPDDLEFFVLFSSAAATMGSPGQTNYSAGNAFMDAFASWRRQQGLAATSVAWGPWDDAGMAADEHVRRQLTSRGMRPMNPQIALDVMRQAISGQTAHVAVMDIDWSKLLSKLPGTSADYFSQLRCSDGEVSSRDEAFANAVKSADPEQQRRIVAEFITSEVATVTGVDPSELDADRPLASLGLDSLMGMELKANLESKAGVEIPPESLFESPTIGSLTNVVLQQLAAKGEIDDAALVDSSSRDHTATDVSFVVNIGKQRSESISSVFCLHPVGGDLRCYRQLARHLTDRNLYGLRASGLDAQSEAHQTLDDMMDDYIASIQQVQPEGPYCLMGWSTGGIFAFEIARRMINDGCAIESLIMLDAPQPTVFKDVDLGDNARFLTDLVDFANYFAGSSMEIGYDELRALSEEEALARILRLSKEQRVLSPDANVDYLRRLINVCKQHVRLFQGFQLYPADLSAHLIRPEDATMLSEATRQDHDEDFGWSRLLSLQMHHVPGHHFTMMTGDGAKALATKVSELLSESQTQVTG